MFHAFAWKWVCRGSKCLIGEEALPHWWGRASSFFWPERRDSKPPASDHRCPDPSTPCVGANLEQMACGLPSTGNGLEMGTTLLQIRRLPSCAGNLPSHVIPYETVKCRNTKREQQFLTRLPTPVWVWVHRVRPLQSLLHLVNYLFALLHTRHPAGSDSHHASQHKRQTASKLEGKHLRTKGVQQSFSNRIKTLKMPHQPEVRVRAQSDQSEETRHRRFLDSTCLRWCHPLSKNVHKSPENAQFMCKTCLRICTF